MSFGRKLAVGFLSSLLTVLLFALAIDVGFARVVGQPKTIENILDKSGIYNSVVPALLDNAKNISSASGDVPLTDSVVQSAATSTLTPEYLRTNVNLILDSIYQWLDGKTSQPTFSINLTDVKTSFADKVADGARQKAAALPKCVTTANIAPFDVFSAGCLPAGVSPDQVAGQVRANIVNGQGFLDNPTISASDLKASGSNQSVFAGQLKNLPAGYRIFKKSPIILGLLIVILGSLMVVIYRPKLRGIKHAGFVIGGVGILTILLGLGLNEAVSNKVISRISLSNAVLEDSLRRVIHDTAHSLSGTYMLIGGVYILLGIAGIGAYYFFAKKEPEAAPVTEKPVSPKPPKKIKVQ